MAIGEDKVVAIRGLEQGSEVLVKLDLDLGSAKPALVGIADYFPFNRSNRGKLRRKLNRGDITLIKLTFDGEG